MDQDYAQELFVNQDPADPGLVAVHLDFDITDFNEKDGIEHYSNYVSASGNRLDTFEVMSNKGLYLMHGKMVSQKNGGIHIRAKSDFVQFVFVMECTRHYMIHDPGSSARVTVGELCQTAFLVKKGSTLAFYWNENKMQDIFEISISIDYLMELLSPDHFLYEKLQQAKSSADSRLLIDQAMSIGPKLTSALYEMVYCKFDGVIKSMYIKGKLIEIFALQQYKYNKLTTGQKTDECITATERNRMMEVRRFLLDNLDTTVSLNELARMVGTNECYLKQNFKHVFGTTVYGYIKQVKMEKARKLLIQNRKKVSEIAQMMGYKHANHFTSAFKKYYGYTPNNLTMSKG